MKRAESDRSYDNSDKNRSINNQRPKAITLPDPGASPKSKYQTSNKDNGKKSKARINVRRAKREKQVSLTNNLALEVIMANSERKKTYEHVFVTYLLPGIIQTAKGGLGISKRLNIDPLQSYERERSSKRSRKKGKSTLNSPGRSSARRSKSPARAINKNMR